MTSDVDMAVAFNNKGTFFLENGQCNHAFDMFMGALQATFLLAEKSEHKSSKHTNENSRIAVARQKQHLLPELQTTHSVAAFPQQGVSSFFYNKPMKIPIIENNSNIDDEARNAICSVAILYNVGLTYHMQSFISPQLQDTSLRKAEVFYKKSISLLTLIEDESIVQEDSIIHLIMAVLNNLGHVNYELHNYELSKSYMEKLCTIVLQQEVNTCNHVHELREQFLLNGTLLEEPKYAAAA